MLALQRGGQGLGVAEPGRRVLVVQGAHELGVAHPSGPPNCQLVS